MIVRPSSSYQLEFPSDISQRIDDRVSSYWIDGQPLLLQLSSFQRTSGAVIAAEERLRVRMDQINSSWNLIEGKLCSDKHVDQATALQYDNDLTWIHSYFVWPHLTIYATISGAESSVLRPSTWARESLAGLALVLH